jgi:hypothetical protein
MLKQQRWVLPLDGTVRQPEGEEGTHLLRSDSIVDAYVAACDAQSPQATIIGRDKPCENGQPGGNAGRSVVGCSSVSNPRARVAGRQINRHH